MSTTNEPDVAQIKSLLSRLAPTQSVRLDGQSDAYVSTSARGPLPTPVRHGVTSGAILFLIANTVMATATVTSAVWFLLFSVGTSGTQRQQTESRSIFDMMAAPAVKPKIGTATAKSPQVAAWVQLDETAHGESGVVPSDRDKSDVAEKHLTSDAAATPASHEGQSATGDTSSAGSRPGSPELLEPLQPPGYVHDVSIASKNLARAQQLIAVGQIGPARLVLETVTAAGSADAAIVLGDTYNPAFLRHLGVTGMVGNNLLAATWYERADELGSSEAKARILALNQKP